MSKFKRTKSSKKLIVLRTVSLTCLLLAIYVIFTLVNSSVSKEYERAKQDCGSELWVVERDAVFYDIRQIKYPYPQKIQELSGEEVVDFACNQTEAQNARQSAESFGTIGYILGLSAIVWMPLILITIIWWLVEESKYLRIRRH